MKDDYHNGREEVHPIKEAPQLAQKLRERITGKEFDKIYETISEAPEHKKYLSTRAQFDMAVREISIAMVQVQWFRKTQILFI